jgi:hypothetical protein
MTMATLSPEEIEHVAQKRAVAKLRWYVHAMVYATVNLFLFLISGAGFGHRPWSAIPMLGWGLGLALHGFSVFVLGDTGFRDRLVQQERDRLRRDRDHA